MFCTQCGAPLVEDASFCGSCGWRRSTAQDVRAEVEAREGRGLKLCIKCRSEIPIDATVCHRCDALQPGADAFGADPAMRTAASESQSPESQDRQTGESLPLATVGRRIGAHLFDLVLIVIVSGIALGAIGSDPYDEGQISGTGIFIVLVILLSYFIISEALTGQTAGKRLVGIRVVTEEGAPVSWGKSAGRNLLRIVDGLPGGLYIVGLIVMSRSDRLQRVGDRAARTIVVMDKH